MTKGQRISAARRAKSLTQQQLADACGVTKNTVSRWEIDRNIPDQARLIQIAAALGFDVAYFDFEDDIPVGHTPSLDITVTAERAVMIVIVSSILELAEQMQDLSMQIIDMREALLFTEKGEIGLKKKQQMEKMNLKMEMIRKAMQALQ